MQNTGELGRIPTLDGWRGVAILLVLVNHLVFVTRFRNLFLARQGATGVDIFFVISGYIITAGLLREGEELNLTAFYGRRALRILPPVIAYLAVLTILATLGLVHEVSPSELLGSLFFVRNYQIAHHPAGIYTGHFWSLAIEEHFYLLWPGLLAFFRPRRALYIASIGAITCALWRHHCLATADPGKSLYFVVIRTDCRLDGLLIGCCLAILTSDPSVRAWIQRNVPKETPILCGFPVVLLLRHSLGVSIWLYLLFAIALGSTLFVHEGLVYKWLNLPALVWIGRLSYGFYVYQEVFLMHPENSQHLPRWQLFPLNMLLLLLVTTVSYYFFERPLLRMAHRIFPALPHPRASSVTPVGSQEATYF